MGRITSAWTYVGHGAGRYKNLETWLEREYHRPQAPLIEAINKLPSGAFEKLPWVGAPADWFGKLAEGTGKRTDLEDRRKA